ERQQVIVKLRFFFDRTPEEIQRYLGVTERVYRRELERAMRQVAERFELVRNGRFCESRRSLILAYVAGIAGPNRMVEARRHLADCPGCARWAMQMRERTRDLAAALPLPAVVARPDSGGGLRHRLLEVVVGAKQHAASVA